MSDALPHSPATPPQARVVDIQRAIGWWTDAWQLFMRNPGLWIAFGVIVLVGLFVLSLIPLLGGIASLLLLPVFMGGWALAARKLDSGGTLEIGDLFAGFKAPLLNPLLIVGVAMLVGGILIGVVAGALGLGAAAGGVGLGALGMGGTGAATAAAGGLFAMLVGLVLSILLGMAIWFAPALVALDQVPPVEAMKASFSASLKNLLPVAVFGVLYLIAAMVASLPMMLGWVLLTPMVMLAAYVSWRDVFGR
jgi:uncharacterized membrane protein